ncbi:MAG: hypothetical protein KGY75_09345 [Candidatus Cloacimonetes bacterium]|nr:hypothetical protein [Candidatus Cloacimonadota bacterium]
MAISEWELSITNDPALYQAQNNSEEVKAQIGVIEHIIATGTDNIGVPGNPYLALLLATYDTNQVDDGTWSLVLKVTDKSNNQSGYSVTFDIDNTAPDVNITTPAENDLLGNSDTVNIEWSISEVNNYDWELYLGGATNPEVTGTKNDPHSYLINNISTIFNNVDGRFGIRVRVIDGAGNIAQHLISVLIDTVSPSITNEISTNGGEDLEIEFDEKMDPSTFIAANFNYTGSGSIDSVDAGSLNKSVELSISSPVDGDEIVVSTDLKDEAGNNLASSVTYSFNGTAWSD